MTRTITGEWLSDPGVAGIMAMLNRAGFHAWFVGGCVRDAILGLQVGDIDVATDARPDQVLALAAAQGVKAVPTGLAHGTVTLVAGRVVEVTTLRRDVATDGRRAVVEFSSDMDADAARRDLTINALYAYPDGVVHDPMGGYDDLMARRIRFIGDAGHRIREDYLRSLRFFRFYAWYGDPDHGPDPDALAAISANLDGLETVSRERVGAEIKKLLTAPDPARATAAMAQTGVLSLILPGADAYCLALLVHFEGQVGAGPAPIRRLTVLGGSGITKSLRLSRAEAASLDAIRTAAAQRDPPSALGYRLGGDLALDAVLARAALTGTAPPGTAPADIARGAAAKFPIKARDLAPLEGPALGKRLKALEDRWTASDFKLARAALLA